MKVVFVNNSKSLNCQEIKDYSSNPGIGGTEYVTIKIISQLYKNHTNLVKVCLATNQYINKSKSLEKIEIIKGNVPIENSIIVCPISQRDYLETLIIKNCRIIYWSHHPHDYIYFVNKKDSELVSLGEYQYFSNSKLCNKHFIIKNPYPRPIPKNDLKIFDRSVPTKFVYLGALGPSKGLHLVLKEWPKIRTLITNAQLNIIGGNLYRIENNSFQNKIPISGSYAKTLEKIIENMDTKDRESVKFLGLLNSFEKDNILKDSDLAFLNPTGKSEAAPASPLECYCYGIPVIAGGDFGSYDNMKYFPELDLMKNNIEKIIEHIINKNNYRDIKNRTYNHAVNTFKMNTEIIYDWIKLFNNNTNDDEPNIPKSLKIKIKYRNLYFRRIKHPIKNLISILK